MSLWKNPSWYTKQQRRQQLDDHIDRTGKARFGLKQVRPEEKVKEALAQLPKVDYVEA